VDLGLQGNNKAVKNMGKLQKIIIPESLLKIRKDSLFAHAACEV